MKNSTSFKSSFKEMDTSEKNIKYPSRVASDQDHFEKDR